MRKVTEITMTISMTVEPETPNVTVEAKKVKGSFTKIFDDPITHNRAVAIAAYNTWMLVNHQLGELDDD